MNASGRGGGISDRMARKRLSEEATSELLGLGLAWRGGGWVRTFLLWGHRRRGHRCRQGCRSGGPFRSQWGLGILFGFAMRSHGGLLTGGIPFCFPLLQAPSGSCVLWVAGPGGRETGRPPSGPGQRMVLGPGKQLWEGVGFWIEFQEKASRVRPRPGRGGCKTAGRGFGPISWVTFSRCERLSAMVWGKPKSPAEATCNLGCFTNRRGGPVGSCI